MLALPNLADLRMQQQIAHEIYRQQIMQRLPDPLCGLLPTFGAHFVPTHPPLHGVEAKLENHELWQQFHNIGTEMIITKCGRRMFPSMRVSLSGLEEDSNYCVLLEMVPIGDCRYKFSGSQWVPAGGAEPQSPQRMYLHPDSPASGKHWQSQPLLFSKVKLTNNTLDNNGHVVLASMHKYQPRLHVIRTGDLAQIPWSPQQAYVFPETEFIAVTAYQNDRITKLKIDNNPFAKGFRETGQSRCKRKLSDSPPPPAPSSVEAEITTMPSAKRLHVAMEELQTSGVHMHRQYLLDTLEANLSCVPQFYVAAQPPPPQPLPPSAIDYARHIAGYPSWAFTPPSPASVSYAHDDCDSVSTASLSLSSSTSSLSSLSSYSSATSDAEASADTFVDVVSTTTTTITTNNIGPVDSERNTTAGLPVAVAAAAVPPLHVPAPSPVVAPKRSSFSILDILGKSVAV